MDDIRVLVVDVEGGTLAEALATALDGAGVRLLGPASDPLEVAARFRDDEVDVAVVDVDGRAHNGLATVSAITGACESARVVGMTDGDGAAALPDVLGAGAYGVVTRASRPEQLVRDLRRARAGELVIR